MVPARRRSYWSRSEIVGSAIAVTISLACLRNTDFTSPPRFDGAGYAVLGESLLNGRGYREIDHPDAPRHAHFPPGYPLTLAILWRATGGRSAFVAHVFSLFCTGLATAVAWRWFLTMYSPRVAGILGVSLAMNWTWGRTGGAVQSEPFYLLLEQIILLGTVGVCRRGGMVLGSCLGLVWGAAILTRQVGVALALASGLALLWKGRTASAMAAGFTSTILIIPWVVWLVSVGDNTQAELIGKSQSGMAELVVSQAIFYAQRLPDQLTGPFVEIATVFTRSRAFSLGANVWAMLASALLILGWLQTLRTPRRRLAGLMALITLGLLLFWPFTEAGRFLIPLVPCLLVGGVEVLSRILARLSSSPGSRPSRTIAATMIFSMSLPYASYSLCSNRAAAQRLTHADFDAACAWIKKQRERPGPVLTRHPGEVYWQTDRQALSPGSADLQAIAREIERRHVAFLLVDDERYANAPANPLTRYVRERAEQVREVWSRGTGASTIRVYEIARREISN